MSESIRQKIILSINRALLGEVFPRLMAVACKIYEEKKFELIFFVSEPLDAEEVEAMSCVETEVIADFDADYDISHSISVSSFDEIDGFDFLVFLRAKSTAL
jgi:hypothetical protein